MAILRNLRVWGCLILVLVFVPRGRAQAVQGSVAKTSVASDLADQTDASPYTIGTSELRDAGLEPSIPDRLLRSWQYQFQLLEQPAVIVAASNGMTETIPNPNKWLQQHSILLNLSEWFPRSTNLPLLVQTAYDSYDPDHTGKRPVFLDKELCGQHKTTLECLASAGSWWGRLFSGASLAFSVSQRDEVQQGVVVPTLTAAEGWAWSGQVDFSPASLFLTSTNWKNAVSVLAAGSDKTKRRILMKGADITKTGDDELRKFCILSSQNQNQPDPLDLHECISKYTKPNLTSSDSQPHTGWADFAAVAIPTFQLKAISQFDFIKQGGILTANPLLQRSLKSLTFTWDLRRLISATTDRAAIGALYAQANKSPKPDDNSKATKLCVLKSKSSTSYISVADDSTMNACRGLAVALGSVDHYAVACASDRIVYIGVPAGINQPAGEPNKPATNCGWIGGTETDWATTQTVSESKIP